jgi:hypothetical protein
VPRGQATIAVKWPAPGSDPFGARHRIYAVQLASELQDRAEEVKMLNTFRKIGDRMLAALTPKMEAGACVPINGQSCCLPGRYSCIGHCIAS